MLPSETYYLLFGICVKGSATGGMALILTANCHAPEAASAAGQGESLD
jgi:hypothetical protein